MQFLQHPSGIYYALYGHRNRKRRSLGTKYRETAQIRFGQFVAEQEGRLTAAPTIGDILDANYAARSEKVRSVDGLRFSCAALKPRLGGYKPEHLTPATIERYARTRGAKPECYYRSWLGAISSQNQATAP